MPNQFKNQTHILGVRIDDISMVQVLNRIEFFLNSDKQHIIFTPNPEICLKAEQDESYLHVLNKSDINTPDGFGLKLGAKILNTEIKNRVTGIDLTNNILKKFQDKSLKIYIINRADSLSTKKDLENLFKQKFTNYNLRVGTTTKENCFDDLKLINDILDFEPTILFVALGAPMQEFWINKNLKLFPSVKLALGIGGTFDFLTGKIKRAPEPIRKIGMEWLYRLYLEPKRLTRIKHATTDFLLTCHKWKKRIDTTYRQNVLGVIINQDNKILLQKNARFHNHWQFPQGGVDINETNEQAVIRECGEELGIPESSLQIIKQFQSTHIYNWNHQFQLLRGYKGQKQTAYLLKFTGRDPDFNFQNSDEVEAIIWLDKKNVLAKIHSVRQEFAAKLLAEL